jgi:MerR family transcriptional regulator, copper efflux regulator
MGNSALNSEAGRNRPVPRTAKQKPKRQEGRTNAATSVHNWLKIGEVASLTGMSVKTIRYYEEIGLLEPTTTRSESGYRLFSNQVLNRLAFIKRSQSLGLSLSEIREILEIHDSGELPCGSVKQHLLLKVKAVSEQIEALEILKSELLGVLSGWQEQPPHALISQTICPNIQQDVASE